MSSPATATKDVPLMESLSLELHDAVKTLQKHLDQKGQPRPSLDKDTPAVVLTEDAPPEVQTAREDILNHALKLFRLAAGPSEYIFNMRAGYQYAGCIQWLWKFQIFDLVPTDSSISYADLATQTNVPIAHMKTVIRMAMTDGIFTEPERQRVSHSAASLYIRSDSRTRDWLSWLCTFTMPVVAAMTDAHVKWPNSESRVHTAYNHAFDTDLPLFDWLATIPERKAHFSQLMRAVSAASPLNIRHTLAGFNWAALGGATVVDLGGSTGHVSIALAREYPDLNFIVQDLPEVIEGAQQYLHSLPDGNSLEDRIQYRTHDLFTPQPVPDAAVYLLRMILHDWGFDDTVKILSCITPALRAGSRILVADMIMPDPGSVPVTKERFLRGADLTMLQNFNSHERDLDDWKGICSAVDGGLKILNIVKPGGSGLSFMELGVRG
ncbi:S-adenosyl-L-methionine-dependent methyltransferase [Aspergillus californicus]